MKLKGRGLYRRVALVEPEEGVEKGVGALGKAIIEQNPAWKVGGMFEDFQKPDWRMFLSLNYWILRRRLTRAHEVFELSNPNGDLTLPIVMDPIYEAFVAGYCLRLEWKEVDHLGVSSVLCEGLARNSREKLQISLIVFGADPYRRILVMVSAAERRYI